MTVRYLNQTVAINFSDTVLKTVATATYCSGQRQCRVLRRSMSSQLDEPGGRLTSSTSEYSIPVPPGLCLLFVSIHQMAPSLNVVANI